MLPSSIATVLLGLFGDRSAGAVSSHLGELVGVNPGPLAPALAPLAPLAWRIRLVRRAGGRGSIMLLAAAAVGCWWAGAELLSPAAKCSSAGVGSVECIIGSAGCWPGLLVASLGIAAPAAASKGLEAALLAACPAVLDPPPCKLLLWGDAEGLVLVAVCACAFNRVFSACKC